MFIMCVRVSSKLTVGQNLLTCCVGVLMSPVFGLFGIGPYLVSFKKPCLQ